MKFVICTDETYEEKYRSTHWQHPQLWEWQTLLGFMGSRPSTTATVYIHTDDLAEVLEHNPDLEVEIRVLADVRYINLEYIDDDGMHSKHFAPDVEPEAGDL